MIQYEITIGGSVFVVVPLPALDSFSLQPRIAPAITELVIGFAEIMQAELKRQAAAALAAGALDEKPADPSDITALAAPKKKLSFDDLGELAEGLDIESLDTSQITPLVSRFCQALPAAELKSLTRDLLNGATCNGATLFGPGGGVFNAVMQGRTVDTWRLLFHALRVNYPDFFAVFAAKDGGKRAESPSAG